MKNQGLKNSACVNRYADSDNWDAWLCWTRQHGDASRWQQIERQPSGRPVAQGAGHDQRHHSAPVEMPRTAGTPGRANHRVRVIPMQRWCPPATT